MRQELQDKALQRLKIIRGQIKGLMKMVEEEAYCPDVLIQSLSVQESLKSFDAVMLENHLTTHVIEQVKNHKLNRMVEELLKVYRLQQN